MARASIRSKVPMVIPAICPGLNPLLGVGLGVVTVDPANRSRQNRSSMYFILHDVTCQNQSFLVKYDPKVIKLCD